MTIGRLESDVAAGSTIFIGFREYNISENTHVILSPSKGQYRHDQQGMESEF